jgi:DNA-directed RNA polymerase specialized sigma24 family protein
MATSYEWPANLIKDVYAASYDKSLPSDVETLPEDIEETVEFVLSEFTGKENIFIRDKYIRNKSTEEIAQERGVSKVTVLEGLSRTLGHLSHKSYRMYLIDGKKAVEDRRLQRENEISQAYTPRCCRYLVRGVKNTTEGGSANISTLGLSENLNKILINNGIASLNELSQVNIERILSSTNLTYDMLLELQEARKKIAGTCGDVKIKTNWPQNLVSAIFDEEYSGTVTDVLHENIKLMLSELTDLERAAIEDRYLSKYAFEEVARRFGVSRNTIMAVTTRAIERLRQSEHLECLRNDYKIEAKSSESKRDEDIESIGSGNAYSLARFELAYGSSSIDHLDLSVRSYNCLRRAGICTVDEVCKRLSGDAKSIRNLGMPSLKEILIKLEYQGLRPYPAIKTYDGEYVGSIY